MASFKRNLRKAAANLRSQNKPVTIPYLVEETGYNVTSMRRLLAFSPEFEIELEVQKYLDEGRKKWNQWNIDRVHDLFATAAKVITEEDDKPCALFISEKLGWNRSRVQRYLQRHSELAERIGLHSDTEASIWRAGRRMRFDCETVTLITLAQATNLSYPTIKSVMARRPNFKSGLALEKGKKGFGQSLYERTQAKKRTSPPKPSVPAWCTGRKQSTILRKPPAFISLLEDRIIFAVVERFNSSRDELTTRQLPGKKGRVVWLRRLAMYLLSVDTKLEAKYIAKLFNAHGNAVWEAKAHIEGALTKLEPELALLRELYSY